MSGAASISVVVAARNAETTLLGTLDSIRSQSHTDWEVVVVDDGSTDGTREIVRDFAATDRRFRVIAQEGAGVSAARNTGIAASLHPWLLFLDADDTILPDMLERVVRRLAADPALDLVEVGWAARMPDGEVFVQAPPTPGMDLFSRAAMFCPFAIHSVVVRKSLIERVGGFDKALRWGEDWDLWLRCGRAGARTTFLSGVGAIYNWRAETGSTHVQYVLDNGLEVTRRIYGPDPRVPDPVGIHVDGSSPAEQPIAEYHHVAWTAGLAMATGLDPVFVLDALKDPCCPTLQPLDVAAPLFYGVLRARAIKPDQWVVAWPGLRDATVRFLRAAERVSGCPHLAERARRALANLALEWSSTPVVEGLDGIHDCELDLSTPSDLRPCPDTARIHARVSLDGLPVGRVLVPVVDHTAADRFTRSEALRQLAWPLVRALYGMNGDGPSPVHLAFGRVLPRRLARHVADTLSRRHKRGFEWLERQVLRRRLYSDVLRERLGSLTAEELEHGVVDLAAGLPRRPLPVGRDITVRLGSAVVGRIAVPPDVRPRRADLWRTITCELRDDLATAVVRVAVDAPRSAGQSLSERIRAAAATSGDAGVAEAARHRAETAPLRNGRAHAFAEASFLLQRAFPPLRRALGRRAIADKLPILAYHQIAAGAHGRAGQYRVDPSAFEAQLALLKEHAYYCVTIEEWDAARRGGRPLRGRPVLITFDDGYADIAETAWPLLRRYGFTATVFVVTERVGTTSSWDRHLAVEAPLLDWNQIRLLEREGLRFGSHTATHLPLGALAPCEIEREVRASRATLHAHLERPAPALAYPYGDSDEAVRSLVRRAGYRFGFTTRSALATRFDDLLDLPRIEVHAWDSPADLARKLLPHHREHAQ